MSGEGYGPQVFERETVRGTKGREENSTTDSCCATDLYWALRRGGDLPRVPPQFNSTCESAAPDSATHDFALSETELLAQEFLERAAGLRTTNAA
jgi:hypothetical protein